MRCGAVEQQRKVILRYLGTFQNYCILFSMCTPCFGYLDSLLSCRQNKELRKLFSGMTGGKQRRCPVLGQFLHRQRMDLATEPHGHVEILDISPALKKRSMKYTYKCFQLRHSVKIFATFWQEQGGMCSKSFSLRIRTQELLVQGLLLTCCPIFVQSLPLCGQISSFVSFFCSFLLLSPSRSFFPLFLHPSFLPPPLLSPYLSFIIKFDYNVSSDSIFV